MVTSLNHDIRYGTPMSVGIPTQILTPTFQESSSEPVVCVDLSVRWPDSVRKLMYILIGRDTVDDLRVKKVSVNVPLHHYGGYLHVL